MADVTFITTVEFTNTIKGSDGGKGYPNELKHVLERRLKEEFPLYDQIKFAKVQQFVFPDQPKAPKLTKRERAFCELITDGYIARDGDADLYWYETKPWKADGMWHCIDESITLEVFDEIPFMFKDLWREHKAIEEETKESEEG